MYKKRRGRQTNSGFGFGFGSDDDDGLGESSICEIDTASQTMTKFSFRRDRDSLAAVVTFALPL